MSRPRIPAPLLKAFGEGAHARRGGARRDLRLEIYDSSFRGAQPNGTLQEAWAGGFDTQAAHGGRKIVADDFALCFDTETLTKGLLKRHDPAIVQQGEMEMTRTAAELEALRNSYQNDVYDPYAAEAEKNGQVPQPFDEAFAAHLAALDAAGPTEAPPPAKAKGKGKAAPKAKEPKAPKAPKEPKAPAGPRTVGFRATSEDRKTINAAAAKLLPKDAKGGCRCLPQDGQTYSDFLQGRVLKVTDGNGEATLNVVTGKNADVIGAIKLTVKDGKLTASPVKA